MANLNTVRDWLEAQHAVTTDRDHIQAIDAVALLLEHRVSPADTAKAVTEALQTQLSNRSEPTSSEHDDYNVVDDFWDLTMCSAIRIFGDAGDRELLIDLLAEIALRPDVIATNGAVMKHRNGKVYWKDLPRWLFYLHDTALCKSELWVVLAHMLTLSVAKTMPTPVNIIRTKSRNGTRKGLVF
jgi:hypothetical protein